jgi:hypothetical protein
MASLDEFAVLAGKTHIDAHSGIPAILGVRPVTALNVRWKWKSLSPAYSASLLRLGDSSGFSMRAARLRNLCRVLLHQGRFLWLTTLAGAEASFLGFLPGLMKLHILRSSAACRTRRAAIYSGCLYAVVEFAVRRGVTRYD